MEHWGGPMLLGFAAAGGVRALRFADASQRGTRDTYIHWLQEQFDQHGIVRNYVTWDYELLLEEAEREM